jgi:hypothetical protein
MHPEAGRSRVYMVLSNLRGLGLKKLLLRRDDSYRLDPEAGARFEVRVGGVMVLHFWGAILGSPLSAHRPDHCAELP